MRLQNTYIITLLVLASCFSTSLFAQTNSKFDPEGWLTSSATFKESIQESISLLKIAEASIKDSATAAQLQKLGYLAITKSRFSTTKTDKYQRSGYWMLSYPVAIKYGLMINGVIDERKNLEKSTNAAFHYWNDLVTEYKDDRLADLIFTESPIAISKYSSNSINYPIGYNQLVSSSRTLKKIKEVYQQSEENTLVGPVEPIVLVHSTKPLSFRVIHHFTQIPTSKLISLNPQWEANRYLPQYGELKLPTNYQQVFEKHMSAMEQQTRDDQILLVAAKTKRLSQLKGDIPDLKRYKPIRYKIKMGDNLGKIAQRYHVKISSLRSWNDLKNDRIYAGQRITIYVPINQKEEIVKASPKKPKKAKKTLQDGEYNRYTVKTGDTLWAISQQFDDVTADMIMEDNGINENISPGQVIKIRKIE